MRYVGLLLFVTLFCINAHAQVLTHDAALSKISKLEADPLHAHASTDMDSLFQWMDQSEDLYVFISDDDLNDIKDQKYNQSEVLYFLMLVGMARYDIEHPDADMEVLEVDKDAGYDCMCNGYRALVKSKKAKKHRFFKKICKDR